MNNPGVFVLMAGAPGGEGAGPGGLGQMMIPMVVIFGIFYFMIIRPQQRKEKDRKAMIASIKSGARVMFSGGILGTVTNVKEHTVIVKVADSVKIEVARGCVNRVLEKDDKLETEEK